MAKSDDNGSNETPPPKHQGDLTPREQFELLWWCSENKTIKLWNTWRIHNLDVNIHLVGAVFLGAHLEGAHFEQAHLEGAHFEQAHLEGARFEQAHLNGAKLREAHLEGADFRHAQLKRADFSNAYLKEAKFHGAFLQGANFHDAELRDTIFYYAHLQSATFHTALVNSATSFWGSEIDKKTDFIGVSLDSVRIEPGTKQLLEYNIRRKNWEKWYENPDQPIKGFTLGNIILKRLVRWFWAISNYGLSTGRIFVTFLAFAFVFAAAYDLWPEFVKFTDGAKEFENPLHAFYFSIVTMTTLGFGDIAANRGSPIGQCLLMLQVILGYVMLGALITRFAILFTAGGPAGKFTEMSDETK